VLPDWHPSTFEDNSPFELLVLGIVNLNNLTLSIDASKRYLATPLSQAVHARQTDFHNKIIEEPYEAIMTCFLDNECDILKDARSAFVPYAAAKYSCPRSTTRGDVDFNDHPFTSFLGKV